MAIIFLTNDNDDDDVDVDDADGKTKMVKAERKSFDVMLDLSPERKERSF